MKLSMKFSDNIPFMIDIYIEIKNAWDISR